MNSRAAVFRPGHDGKNVKYNTDGRKLYFYGTASGEAAVTPDYHRVLIANIGYDNAIYFGLYNLDQINEKFDRAGDCCISLKDLNCLNAFQINNSKKVIDSVKGYDIDNDNNVYISSQLPPQCDKNGKVVTFPRKIIKIPWGVTDSSQWETVDLSYADIDISGLEAELKNVQVIRLNDVYLTVAYHKLISSYGNYMLKQDSKNRIYEVTWD